MTCSLYRIRVKQESVLPCNGFDFIHWLYRPDLVVGCHDRKKPDTVPVSFVENLARDLLIFCGRLCRLLQSLQIDYSLFVHRDLRHLKPQLRQVLARISHRRMFDDRRDYMTLRQIATRHDHFDRPVVGLRPTGCKVDFRRPGSDQIRYLLPRQFDCPPSLCSHRMITHGIAVLFQQIRLHRFERSFFHPCCCSIIQIDHRLLLSVILSLALLFSPVCQAVHVLIYFPSV